jgi:hypothetical protein
MRKVARFHDDRLATEAYWLTQPAKLDRAALLVSSSAVLLSPTSNSAIQSARRIIDKSALAKKRSTELLRGLHCPQWRAQHRAGEPRPRLWNFASFSHVGIAR